jgi:N-acetylmuramoyl-L-alanine amidase
MRIDESHLLDMGKRDLLPGGAVMAVRRFLVIHYTAGATAQSSVNYWKQLANGICAHFVIDRDGGIIQCRPCNRTAGHAGASNWKDPKTGITYHGLNSCSIGIELANAGDNATLAAKWMKAPTVTLPHKNGGAPRQWEAYPEAQLAACTRLSQTLVKRYRLDDVVGHDDISPRRKSDPGPAFPMQDLREACGFQGLPSR